MKISSDGRAPLNVVDAFWAMCWSSGVGQIYRVVWAKIQGSTRSSSRNVKVIVRISLLAGSFIGEFGVDILRVFLHHHFRNMWKVPMLHQ